MSIENNLASIAKSLESIARTLEHTENYVDKVSVAPVTQTAQPAPAPTQEIIITPASPNVVIEELPLPPLMPEAPPAPLAAPAAVVGAPFTDAKGLIAYIMDSYKSLGPVKGAKIQEVLTSIGYANVNDVKPESYGALFAGVEALKS